MHESDVYSLTPSGEHQLRGAMTTAAPAEMEMLIRADGVLTVGQIKAGMGSSVPQDFNAIFARLISQGLLRLRIDDPFADQFSIKPSRNALKLAAGEADAGTASLQKAGYFVRIARQRGARTVAAGEELSALIVEDEPNLAKFLQHYLSFEGFNVRLAATRVEVVAELRRARVPDLVLLDVMLPDLDGFDILLRMRQHPSLKAVPVIMMTGLATREAVIKGLAGGADGYITKPFEADALLEAVRTVVGLTGEAAGASLSIDPWPEKAR